MSLYKNFSKRLAHELKTKYITQNELAMRSGVSQSQISELVTGKRVPRLSTLHALARALGISVRELLGEEEK